MPHNPENQDDSVSTLLGDISHFVEQQSETRFRFDAKFLPLFDVLDRQLSTEEGGTDLNIDEEKSASGSRSKDRKQQIITEMWNQFHRLKKSNGYDWLHDLKTTLEGHLHDEKKRFDTASTKAVALLRYQDVLERNGGATGCTELMRDVFPPSSYGDELSGPVEPDCQLKWFGPSEEEAERRRGEALYRGEITMRGVREGDDSSPTLKFSPDATMKAVWDSLRDRASRSTDDLDKQRIIFGLIDLRKTLLERFLWTLEVTGRVPDHITVSNFPEVLRDSPTRVRHACTVLNLRPYLPGSDPEGIGRKTIENCISDRLNHNEIGHRGPDAVVTGAAGVVKNVLADRDNKSIDAEFWRLLDRYEDLLREAAEEIDIDVPTPREVS